MDNKNVINNYRYVFLNAIIPITGTFNCIYFSTLGILWHLDMLDHVIKLHCGWQTFGTDIEISVLQYFTAHLQINGLRKCIGSGFANVLWRADIQIEFWHFIREIYEPLLLLVFPHITSDKAIS